MMVIAWKFLTSRLGKYALIAAAIGLAVLKIFIAGKNAERRKNLERQNKSLRIKADALETAANADIDVIRQRLRERASR